MKDMYTKIMLIPVVIKRAVLLYFNSKCRELHAIAFL